MEILEDIHCFQVNIFLLLTPTSHWLEYFSALESWMSSVHSTTTSAHIPWHWHLLPYQFLIISQAGKMIKLMVAATAAAMTGWGNSLCGNGWWPWGWLPLKWIQWGDHSWRQLLFAAFSSPEPTLCGEQELTGN
jgi:hypothetical protein